LEHLEFQGWASGHLERVDLSQIFFDKLGRQLEYSSFSDWYNITKEEVIEHGGNNLLSYYEYSPVKALLSIYPEFDWIIWKFRNAVPQGFWKQKINQRQFFDWLGKQLGFNSGPDWYNITREDVIENEGEKLLQFHNYSLVNALISAYPEHHLLPWKFVNIKQSAKLWHTNYHVEFLNEISQQLGISQLEDWYRVSREDLIQCRAETFLKTRDLIDILEEVYPTYQWDETKFNQRVKKSTQWWLYKVVKDICPSNTEVFEEYAHPFLKLQSGYPMIFDIYVPSFDLAIEYHGAHHYQDHIMFGAVASLKERDHKKIEACNSVKITYIEVPYWWQHDKESIAAIVHQHRPDIVSASVPVVPFEY